MPQAEPIALANRKVPMAVACRAAGMELRDGSTKKHYCPFGEYSHLDGGDEPAFRVYDDHAYCFACTQWWSPVSLCVAIWEVTEEAAAERLLVLAGISQDSYEKTWARLQENPAVSVQAVGEALRTRMAAEFPRWDQLQYTGEVAHYLSRCLGLLSAVKTEDDAREWLSRCSAVMRVVLRRNDA